MAACPCPCHIDPDLDDLAAKCPCTSISALDGAAALAFDGAAALLAFAKGVAAPKQAHSSPEADTCPVSPYPCGHSSGYTGSDCTYNDCAD